MKSIQDIFPLLQPPKKIWITTHYKPDGDAIGSILALSLYLRKLGHTVTTVSPCDIPDFLGWLPEISTVYNYEAESSKVLALLQEADLIFGLDFNAFHRTKHLDKALATAKGIKVLIDHHLEPAPVWEYGVSDPNKSSTCEMVYDFINLHGGNAQIDTDIAACLYTGLMTDTGSFRFPATTASSHLMVADLQQKGLIHSPIHEAIYDSWSPARMRFLGYILLEKMELYPDMHTGIICISKKDMKQFQVNTGDMEGLVNYPLSIQNIKFSVLITEQTDEIKLSFRSKGNFDVSHIARTYFQGGGHFNAAGGRSSESFEKTIAYFKKILPDIHPGSITLQTD